MGTRNLERWLGKAKKVCAFMGRVGPRPWRREAATEVEDDILFLVSDFFGGFFVCVESFRNWVAKVFEEFGSIAVRKPFLIFHRNKDFFLFY